MSYELLKNKIPDVDRDVKYIDDNGNKGFALYIAKTILSENQYVAIFIIAASTNATIIPAWPAITLPITTKRRVNISKKTAVFSASILIQPPQ